MTTRGILLLPALLVPLILVGVLARRSERSDERWRRMEAWAEAAERGWEQRDFERAPVWGEEHAGIAFQAYARAVALATELCDADRELGRRLRLEPAEISPEEAEAFARRWAPALAALSRGAHLRGARPLVEWDEGYANETARLLVLRDLANAATVEVRRRLARGDALAAVELSLDAATFASDLLQSPVLIDQMVACALVAIATGETWRDEDLQQLDEDALSLLAKGLARVDERCPLSADWRGEALLLANELSVAVGNANPSLGALDGDASLRELAADAVLHQVELWQGLESGGDDPWPERERALAAASNDEALRENPVLEVTMASWTSVERSLRSSAATVRLLRVAVAHHRGAELPELSDPLGAGALEVEPGADGGLRVRSAGWPDQRSLERLGAPR